MAKLSSILCFFVLLNVAFAARQQQPRYPTGTQSECQIQRLQALQPTNQIRAQAGSTDVWDHQEEQLKCAGVTVIRHTIEPRGLLLPNFVNAPQLIYIIQGKGIQGTLMPGCPDTYQSAQSPFEFGRQGREEQGERGWTRGEEEHSQSRFQDRHQKIRHFRAGDVLAVPAGVSHWAYNDGQEELVAVVLIDNTNFANQLDITPRRFYLAGNPEQEHEQSRRHQQHGRHQQGHHQQGSQGSNNKNVFFGFDAEWLAQIFKVDRNIIEKLQGQNDERGNIVRVEGGLQVIQPPRMTEPRQGGRRESERPWGGRHGDNGFEETLCTMRLRENINDPERADIYTPRGGRISTLNSMNLPVLSWLDLSVERGVLYQNGIVAPHYYSNAHSITYVTKGRARIQVVDDQGQTVYDDVISEGQLLVEPQNYVVLKQALEDGYEYVSFKTSDNAFRNTLAGRNSVIRGLPAGVIANAYQISEEDASKLKFNRDETTVFQGQRSSERLAVA